MRKYYLIVNGLKYIRELQAINQDLTNAALDELFSLPENCYLNRNIKHFKTGKHKFYELRVRNRNNICRFFFIIENPNLIVIHGFTKKTQKTEGRDIEKAISSLLDYQKNMLSLKFDRLLFDN